MYGDDTFKSLVIPYCFRTKIKKEDAQLVQTEEVAGLLWAAIISMMVALAFVRQRLQHAGTNLGQNLASKVILGMEELDVAASTNLGHALCLAVSSFNILSEVKGGSKQIMGFMNELVGMLNKDYPSCLGELYKGNRESAVST